ncbi:MAG: universal stress protein, partial [Bacteroidales bacterium]|nr:universal stress protein [Bacteroidales bacterium]
MIKKILVAIDFSDCSVNALEHAITIAEKAKADILMVWVNKPESAKEINEGKPENLQYEVNKRFNNLKNKYRSVLGGGKLLTKVRDGKVYKEVVAEANEWGADMIIVGTHGASGFEEFWVGSNAMKIVSSTSIPVITIRGGVDIGRELKLIVLPIDSTPETRQKVPF